MDNFKESVAQIYDFIYEKKDYNAELNYVLERMLGFNPNVKSILEIGCGTGNYSKIFIEKGYDFLGIDLSESMIEIARKKVGNFFSVADATRFRIDAKVDAVVALFHVFNYLKNDDERINFFLNAYNNLKSGGLLVFDFWHGPAVYYDPPKTRVLRIENELFKILRLTETDTEIANNIINVHFDFYFWNKQNNDFHNFQEIHRMKLVFIEELVRLSSAAGFKVSTIEKWLNPSKSLEIKDWFGLVILKRN